MRFYILAVIALCNWSILCWADASLEAKRFESPTPEDWPALMQSPYFGRYPNTLWEGLQQLWPQNPQLALNLLFEPQVSPGTDKKYTLFSLPLKELDAQNKEALANIYLFLIRNLPKDSAKSVTDKAFFRLYRELADTQAGQQAVAMANSPHLASQITWNDRLAHAFNLDNSNRMNELIEFLAPWLNQTDIPVTFKCEANYLAAKAYRQMQQYPVAQSLLSNAQASCKEPLLRQTRYLQARLAAISPTIESEQVFDDYLAAYPKHPSSADVLLWKAASLQRLGETEQAQQTREQLSSTFPFDNTSIEARFLNAFHLAQSAHPQEGLAQLEELAKQTRIPLVQREKATYWHARLQIYPQNTLVLNPNQTAVKQGTQELLDFEASHPTRYYGLLANLLLAGLKHQKALAQPLSQENLHSKQPPADSVVTPAYEMLHAGFAKAAVTLADILLPTQESRASQVTIAEFYNAAGYSDKAYRILWKLGLTDIAGPLNATTVHRFVDLYPPAFDDAVSFAAHESQIDKALLHALIREESFFNPDIISWAGAVGLCQLMPFTAEREAKELGITIANNQLTDVSLNTRLGARHLARHLRDFTHPALGIAAYNSGPHAVKRWLDSMPADEMPLDIFVENIPYKETREYVKRVMSSWQTYQLLSTQPEILHLPVTIKKD